MEAKDISVIIVPLISAGLSSFLTYSFAVKSKKQEDIRKYKEEKYSNLIILLQAFVGNTANANGKKDFLKENYKSWLYCSDEVTISINKMIALIRNKKTSNFSPLEGRNSVGKIVLEMRKDLNGKTKLTENDFEYIDVIE